MEHSFQKVKSAFAEYLSLPEWDWDWFITQTFDPKKFKRARNGRLLVPTNITVNSWKDFIRFTGSTANACWGFMFGELHRSGMPHWHALVHVQANLFDQPSRTDMWRHMWHRYGRFEARPYEPAKFQDVAGACSYLTKYVAKEAFQDDATWDFKGFLAGSEADSRQIVRACGVDGRTIL